MRDRIVRLALGALLLTTVSAPMPAQQVSSTSLQWQDEIRQFERADRRHPPPKGAVLFVGSSSIRLWQTLQQDFPGQQVINRGFGGSELGDVVYFADRIVLPYKPRIIVLYAGDNDLAAGKSPDHVFADYKRLVSLVRHRLPETRIAFIAIKPSLARWNLINEIRRTNALVQGYVRADSSHDARLQYVDVFTPMLGPDGTPRKELFVDDGLHMNTRGYALWKETLDPFLK
jgi:lysophospholipase L1-like esterase